VVIPVGPGHAKFVPDALESLIGQTFRDWACVVVDDSNFEVMEARLDKTYPFLEITGTTKAYGAGRARNLGLKESQNSTRALAGC
jgi:glycosyltransferase involved in cell wall biosynthesis